MIIAALIVGMVYLIVSRVIAVFGSALYGLEHTEDIQHYVSLSALYGVEGWLLKWSLDSMRKKE